MASTIRRVAAGVGAVGLLAIGVQLLGTTSASAHDNLVSGTAACQADGTYTVTWTVTNDYQLTDTVTVNSFGPGGALNPNTLTLTPTGTAGASGTMTQTGVAGTATGADLDVKGYWKDDNYTVDSSKGHVPLPGTCLPGKEPTAPTWADGACVNNAVTQPTITIPNDAGVSYAVDGAPRNAGSFPAATGPHKVVASSTQFVLSGQTSWSFTLTTPVNGCTTTVVPVIPTITQTTCVNHSPTAPTVTLPTTPGITYTITKGTGPNGTYVTTDKPVVTATPKAGSVLGALTGGWTKSGDSATYTVTFTPAQDCNDKTVPVTPTVTQTACVNHAPTAPTLTIVPTSGIKYVVAAGPYAPGQSVVVKATTLTGYELGTLPSTWTKVNSTTATTTVTFAASTNCGTAVTPVTPNVDQAACLAGSTTPTAPSLTFDSTPGLSYTVNKAAPYATGQTVVVTATAGKNHYLSGVTSGWKLVSDTVATRTITFAAGPNACTLNVTATKATFSAQQCVSGAPTTATYTIPKTTGVVYQANGKPTAAGTYSAAAGSTVTVVAVPKAHYKVSGQSVWKQTFGDTPQCSNQDNQTAHRPAGDTDSNSANGTGPLADTGTPTSSLLGVGLGLLVLGGLLTVVATRRRSSREH